MKEYLRKQIWSALQAAGIQADIDNIHVESPKQADHGDLATNIAMLLTKQEKKSPRDIAANIIEHFPSDPEKIAGLEIAGPGFINVRFANGFFQGEATNILSLGSEYGKGSSGKGKSVNVEWVSANPTGPLHAGHGRQVCLGETLCTLLEWMGWDVTREYYFNNAGNQMNNLAITVRERYLEELGNDANEDNIHYAGDYVKQIAKELSAEHGDAKQDADLDFFQRAGELWCFARIKETLNTLGVHHDIYFNEDTLYKDGKIDEVLQILKDKGLSYEKEGAVWLKTTEFGTDKDRVIVKATGEPTYRLPDIAYHREKIRRSYDTIIDIFGADHVATIPDVLAGVRSLGEKTEHIEVIIHQMVSFLNEGEAVKMSKRSGNVYSLDDLIEGVGVDAVRYFFVMRGVNTHLDFDIKLALEQSENNPMYYLQYAHARIASILRFAEQEGLSDNEAGSFSVLNHPSEISLMKTLLGFPELLSFCAESHELHPIGTYLHDVATAFHKFYHDCRVVSEDKELSAARIGLCRATKQVLANGFGILGISAPEKM
jgi:arginyl-tRNA synthetase